jgi:hypothetical protein
MARIPPVALHLPRQDTRQTSATGQLPEAVWGSWEESPLQGSSLSLVWCPGALAPKQPFFCKVGTKPVKGKVEKGTPSGSCVLSRVAQGRPALSPLTGRGRWGVDLEESINGSFP